MRKVCAVIVSYNPDEYLITHVAAILPQVDKLLVVDNGSAVNSRAYLEAVAQMPAVDVIYNGENLGIAAALNIAARFAQDEGYAWLATFDQDSCATPELIESMLSTYETCGFKEKVALISPVYLDQSTGTVELVGGCTGSPEQIFSTAVTTMTSGNLVKSSTFSKVGFFEESLFIDYVDNEFCLRCLQRDLKILVSCKSVLQHKAGEPVRHSLLWKRPVTSNHSPLRRYYSARNRVVMYKRYFRSRSEWVYSDLYIFLKEIAKIILFEKDMLCKVRFISKGVYHGITGKMGKYG